VLVVDEAQNLAPELLEQVRLLTNLETNTQKLLQIILIGQPELRDLLARNDLRQVAQRITGRYHLAPLSRAETAAYVRHRLRVAGSTSDVFTPWALRELYRLSGGIPRVINVISDRALLGAYTQDCHRVTRRFVCHAASEVFGRYIPAWWLPWAAGAAAVVALALGATAIWKFAPWQHTPAGQIITQPTQTGTPDPPPADASASGQPAIAPPPAASQSPIPSLLAPVTRPAQPDKPALPLPST
jgi:general secretion pathway protein A